MANTALQNRVYICLGSNIDAEQNLPAAVRLLGDFGTVVAVSNVYETLPVGFAAQANFLNAAVLLETDHRLEEILGEIVPCIERSLGRQRDPANPNGPRTIDLDVALFNDAACRIARHELPDPDIDKYPFVAIPLAELEPRYSLPTTGETLAEVAARFQVTVGDMRRRVDVRLIDGT